MGQSYPAPPIGASAWRLITLIAGDEARLSRSILQADQK
jgi:hypothetical protein